MSIQQEWFSDMAAQIHQEQQWADTLARERYERTLDALMNCKRAGSDLGDLEFIASELGVSKDWRHFQERVQP